MSRPTTKVVAGVSASDWIPLNHYPEPFNVGFGVVLAGGGDITYSVQHTFDDVFDPNVTPTAFDHSDVSGRTASVDGNYAFAVRGVRLNVTAASGNATAALTVIQAGY